MALKDFIDSHPLAVLVGLSVAVASTTAGVTNYVTGQRIENEKTKIEVEYKSEISTLKIRLASIERKLGSDEKGFFDVSQLVITQDRVKELDSSYKRMGGGVFFIAEPSMRDWKYSLTSELELAKVILGETDTDAMFSKLAPALGKPNVHLWRRSDTLVIHPKPKKGLEGIAPKKLVFFPSVLVQTLNTEDLPGIVSELHKTLNEDSEIEAISKRIDALHQETKKMSPLTATQASDPIGQQSNAPQPAQDERSAKIGSTGATKLETEEALAQLFRGDMAAIMLAGLIAQTMKLPQMFPGAQAALGSVQKKGNVLYVQSRTEFNDIEIDGKTGENKLFVDQEFFIVTNPKTIFVVKVQIPSIDGRSDAFPWIGQWLSGFRVLLARL